MKKILSDVFFVAALVTILSAIGSMATYCIPLRLVIEKTPIASAYDWDKDGYADENETLALLISLIFLSAGFNFASGLLDGRYDRDL